MVGKISDFDSSICLKTIRYDAQSYFVKVMDIPVRTQDLVLCYIK